MFAFRFPNTDLHIGHPNPKRSNSRKLCIRKKLDSIKKLIEKSTRKLFHILGYLRAILTHS